MKQDPKTSTPKKNNVWSLYRTASERYNENIQPLHSIPDLEESNFLNNNEVNSCDRNIGKIDYMLKYQQAQRDNNILLLSLRDREREIEKLKSVIKNLQSESESSDSRQEKSTSTSSSLPVVRVTPQKRSKPNTVQSPRRSGSRRLLFNNQNSQSSDRASMPYSRQILRNAGIDSDILLSSSSNSTPRARDLNRNQILANDMVSISTTPTIRSANRIASTTPAQTMNNSSRSATNHRPTLNFSGSHGSSNDTFVVERLGRLPGNPPPTLREEENHPPSYYLNLNRPSFVRRSELRQSIIREASRRRSEIEAKRKEAVRALAMGTVTLDEVTDRIFVDPTKIQAFPKNDMRAITHRRFSSTREYRDRIMEREKKIEQATNRILKTCFSYKTRSQLLN